MAECTPGTPGISEARPETCYDHHHHHHGCSDPGCEQPRVQGGGGRGGGSSSSIDQLQVEAAAARAGTRKAGMRAEIDTSPPFGSVKEAVTHFGGSGTWLPYYKFGDGYQAVEDIDIKKVEEQAAELEKDLIVKELETLDVLEELATTKRIVEELKRQLQNEALRCVQIQQNPSPATKGTSKGSNNVAALSPFHGPGSSPDLILMELRQAKLNLGKTIDDLGVIQASVECLHKKMRADKGFLEKTRRRLTSNFAGVLSLGEELKQARVMTPQVEDGLGIEYRDNRQLKTLGEAEEMSQNGLARAGPLRTAELRLVAARKMEEAARAAEAVALAEINALSANERPSRGGYVLPEPQRDTSFPPLSPLNLKGQDTEMVLKKKAQVNISKMSILKRLKEAREEVNRSKQALEEALNKVETANRKQFATEEALRKWMPAQEDEIDRERERKEAYYPAGFSNFPFHHQQNHVPSPPSNEMIRMPSSNPHIEGPKPVLRSNLSMRDVLSKKQQAVPQEYAAARPAEGGERQKVALSQMLDELRGDLTFHPRAEKVVEQKQQLFTQRRKFGFIHIALPMTRLSKKKVQDFNNVMN